MSPNKTVPPCSEPFIKHCPKSEVVWHTFSNSLILEEGLYTLQHIREKRLRLYTFSLWWLMLKTTIISCTQKVVVLNEVLFVAFVSLQCAFGLDVQLFWS